MSKKTKFFNYTPADFKPDNENQENRATPPNLFQQCKIKHESSKVKTEIKQESNLHSRRDTIYIPQVKQEVKEEVKEEVKDGLVLLPDLDDMDIEETIEQSRQLLDGFQSYVNYQSLKRQIDQLEQQLRNREETIVELEHMMQRQQNQLYIRNLEIEQLKEQQKDILSLLDRRTAVLVATVKTNETNINKLALDFQHIMNYIKFKKQPNVNVDNNEPKSQ